MSDMSHEEEPTSEDKTEETPRFIRAAHAMVDLFEQEARTVQGTSEQRAAHFMHLTMSTRPITAEAQDYDFMAMQPDLVGTERFEQLGQELYDRIQDPVVPERVRSLFMGIYGEELARFAPPLPPEQ